MDEGSQQVHVGVGQSVSGQYLTIGVEPVDGVAAVAVAVALVVAAVAGAAVFLLASAGCRQPRLFSHCCSSTAFLHLL